MPTVTGRSLKSEWMNLPEECFAVLTFGELKLGQKFIPLPRPGDSRNDCGFRRAHHLFTKKHESVEGDEYHSMPVILVK